MTTDRLPAGTVISGRFELGDFLGAGGLGEVYAASDLKADKQVAIRILASDLLPGETASEQLRSQVSKASKLSHKNIGRIIGMGKENALRYLVMELIEGQNLRQLLERKRQAGRTFSLKGAYNVLAHVCNALHEGHKTMVHGMPGPGAILINRAGRIKVVDFGIATALAPGSSAVARLGDFYTLAPEMHRDPMAATPAADIYSVGVVLHELLTGQPPTDPPEPMASLIGDLPAAVEQVVSRCLAPDPADRLADAQQVKAAFYRAIEGQSSGDGDGIAATGAQQAYDPPTVPPKPAPTSRPMEPGSSAPRSAPPAQPIPGGIAPGSSAPRPATPIAAPGKPVAQPIGQPGGPMSQSVGQPLSPASSAAHPLAQQPAHQVSIEELLAQADTDTTERWLIQKDRLDFGPFSSGALKRALYKAEFSGDDVLVDQDNGQRMQIRQHPDFTEFMRHLDRHLAQNQAKQVVMARAATSKRRTVMVTMIVLGLVLLAAGGVVAAWLLTRDPEIREKVVYRERTKTLAGIKGLEVQWKAEPPDQARARRRHKRRRKPTSAKNTGDVTHFGDATKAGGDALLSQKIVQGVMRTNFGKLTSCVQQEWRRNRGLRKVDIAFGILGSGTVSSVKVNGQASGPFQSCVSRRMRAIRFPKFDGTLTRASFSMKLSI